MYTAVWQSAGCSVVETEPHRASRAVAGRTQSVLSSGISGRRFMHFTTLDAGIIGRYYSQMRCAPRALRRASLLRTGSPSSMLCAARTRSKGSR